MKTTPDISIIIPAYNVEQYIGQCLDSILCQDGAPDFEIIVVNDGSTDNTGKIVSDYRQNYGNVHLITQKNRGVSAARNYALSVARGRFISFIDADDMVGVSYEHMQPYFINIQRQDLRSYSDNYRNNMHITFMYFKPTFNMDEVKPIFDTQYFARLMNPLRENNTDISFGGKITIDSDTHGLLRHIYEYDQVYDSDPDDKQKILYHADIRESANFALYRRKFLETAKLNFIPGMNLDEDMLFTQQAVLRARNVATVANATYLYNRHVGTLSNLTPSFIDINSKYELAMIQRHSMILSELAQIPRYRSVYNYFLKRYAGDEQSIKLFPESTLPGYCTQCNQRTCDRCPTKSSILSLLQYNIEKHIQR